MSLIDPFLQMANAAGLFNAAPYDPIAPTFVAHAGDFALLISATPDGGEFGGFDARISVSYGLDKSGSPDELSSLNLIYDTNMGLWRLEFELKGDQPPAGLLDLAGRFGLSDPDESVGLVQEHEWREVAQAMVVFIAAETDRLANRVSGQPSKIPLPDFLASGGGHRLP